MLLTAGSALLKDGLLWSAVACWALVVPIIVAALFDRIEFDGRAIRHRGPLAFLMTRLARVRREL